MSIKRTDCHRPGAIIPSDYAYLLSYRTPGTDPHDCYGMKEVRAVNDTAGPGKARAMFGRVGKCGVCGAHYREGDIWTHKPSGALLHIGHDCAEKYELLADRDDFDAGVDAMKRRRAAEIQAEKNREDRAAFFAKYPGLKDALALDHSILIDMARKVARYGSLSEKQVAFAFKLATEIAEKAKRPVEVNIPAPTGRLAVRGTIVSLKPHESEFGVSMKMTVKVTTPAGVWLAWGTCPESLCLYIGWQTRNADGSPAEQSEDYAPRAEVGDVVEFTGTLSAGREPHFALFKRPSKARVVVRKHNVNGKVVSSAA